MKMPTNFTVFYSAAPLFLAALMPFSALFSQESAPNDALNGPVSREVLENYLSRAVTEMALLHSDVELTENIRMLKNIGAKFIGRSIFCWGGETFLLELKRSAPSRAAAVHAADPEMILQACVFEAITRQVEEIPIPAYVFEAFGLQPEERHFDYDAMVSDWGRDRWNKDESVPDISLPETRLWFYYASTIYIDIGCEAIHFGQVDYMSQNRPELWVEVLEKVRDYAKNHARRGWVLCDGHVPSCGMVVDGRLLLDFHSFPLRVKEIVDRPQEGVLEVGYLDTIYRKSKGGVTPSGWPCEHLPYLAEIDNWGRGPAETRGKATPNSCWIWGFDEIDWFANQPETYRNEWLEYAWNWFLENDPDGRLQMPGCRCLHDPNPGLGELYRANTRSDAAPNGFGQEETIKRIWNTSKSK